MNIKKRLVLSCAAIGFSSLALLAHAEAHVGHCKDQANQQECCQAHMAKSNAKRSAAWHDELKITAAQEPAWKAFVESFPQHDAKHADHKKADQADTATMSAPERLEQRLAMIEKHHAAMQTHLTKLKALYAELTPEQQTLLNKRLNHFKHKHHQHRKHRDHHHSSPTNTD